MSSGTRSFALSAMIALACIAIDLAPGRAQQPPRISGDLYSQLHWRFIGPEGNRSDAAAGIPTQRIAPIPREHS